MVAPRETPEKKDSTEKFLKELMDALPQVDSEKKLQEQIGRYRRDILWAMAFWENMKGDKEMGMTEIEYGLIRYLTEIAAEQVHAWIKTTRLISDAIEHSKED